MIPLSVRLLGEWIKWWGGFEGDTDTWTDKEISQHYKEAAKIEAATLKYITHTFGFKKVDGVWIFPEPPADNEAGVTISDSATVTVNRKESL